MSKIETYSRSGAVYQKKELLGYGTYASVFRYINLATQKDVAIKIYVYPQVYKNTWRSRLHQTECLIRQEIYIMTSIQHPYILSCDDLYYRKEYKSIDFGIVINVATYDFSVYMRSMPTTNKLRKKYMEQFLSAISFLHKSGYLHCDLKVDNILYYKATDSLKLSDFGVCISRAKYRAGDIRKVDLHCSPVSTRAPELLEYSITLKEKYKSFWSKVPPGIIRDPNITDLYRCECYSIGNVLLGLNLWRDIGIFETQEMWTMDFDQRLGWINKKYIHEDEQDVEVCKTIARLMDFNPETRLTDLDSISWKIEVECVHITPPVTSPISIFSSDEVIGQEMMDSRLESLSVGIKYLYSELVRQRERIYTLGQVLGLYHRIMADDPTLIQHPIKIAICSIYMIIIRKSFTIKSDKSINEDMDTIMELMLQKFMQLNGIIYTSTIDTLTTDSYLAWKSLVYYINPKLMSKYTPIEYLNSIPNSDIERIDIHSELQTYVEQYGELL